MPATKSLAECPDHITGWRLTVNGVEQPPNTVWSAESPFGSVSNRVVVDEKGKAVFDRPEYREAPSVNLVAYGFDKETGGIKIGIIRQPRPHADDPLSDGQNLPVVFGQTPMGFIGKIFGEDIPQGEDGRVTAGRQVKEETGSRVILEVFRPEEPYHNVCPTFVATWCGLYFVKVDLEQINALRYDRREPIFSAEFVTPEALFRRIREGIDEEGAIYRMGNSNATWMIFFATFPQYLPR